MILTPDKTIISEISQVSQLLHYVSSVANHSYKPTVLKRTQDNKFINDRTIMEAKQLRVLTVYGSHTVECHQQHHRFLGSFFGPRHRPRH